MTAQFSDVVVYQDQPHALVDVDGSGLFDPDDHGLRVSMITTACWRGYICEYTVEEDQLFLSSLQIGGSEPPDELFGAHVHLGGLAAAYWPIRARQEFTGRLLLGTGFIHDLYEHVGHHPAWKYTTVLELTFENGQLQSVHDRSETTAQQRAAQSQTRSPKPRSRRRILLWLLRNRLICPLPG